MPEPIFRETIRPHRLQKARVLFNADTCEVMNRLHEQSPDINQGVERAKDEDQGAGDQGMMFGYASHETANYMPLALDLSHRLLQELAAIRRERPRHALPAPRRQEPGYIRYSDDHRPRPSTPSSSAPSTTSSTRPEATMLDRIKTDVLAILIPA
jgi:S-adenosylmethionine synthetase